MTAFERPKGSGKWRAKFVLKGRQVHVPGSPFRSKRQAEEAERRHRDKLLARRTEETCASFAERWLEEWPRPRLRPAGSTEPRSSSSPSTSARPSSARWNGSRPAPGRSPSPATSRRSSARCTRTPGISAGRLQPLRPPPAPDCEAQGPDHPADAGAVLRAAQGDHGPRWLRPGVQGADHLRRLDRDADRRAPGPAVGRRRHRDDPRPAGAEARRHPRPTEERGAADDRLPAAGPGAR
jgi:hypothetical protein